MTARNVINIVTVCSTGALTGVLLNIGLAFGGYWQSLPPAEFLSWFSQNNSFIARSVAVVLFPTLIGLAISLWLGWADAVQRRLWLGTTLCLIVLLALTAIINGPMNNQFAGQSVAASAVPGMLKVWLMSHAVRVALALSASILGAVALSRQSSAGQR